MKNLDIGRKTKAQPEDSKPSAFPAASQIQEAPHDHAELVFVTAALPAEKDASPPKKIFKFRKSFVLAPFMIFVLLLGSIIGTRFIHFASSVSLSSNTFYRNVSDTVGSVLSSVPILKNLDQSNLQQAIRGKQRVNILLLGYGGDGHQGGYLTDSIMVLHLDFAAGKAAMISVPRDTWVQIPTSGDNGGYWKVNAAYAFGLDDRTYPRKQAQFTGSAGGGNLAKYEISKILGMPIDYFIAVDFDGFKEIVNDLGGVEVSVDNAFTDYTYPESDQTINGSWCTASDEPAAPLAPAPGPSDCRYKKVHFDAGQQFMSGARALEYARSRHAAGIEGSDFARAKRQQKLMAAIEKKALSINALPKALSLMQDAAGHFTTDMSFAEIKDLSSYLKDSDLQNAARLSINDNGLLVSGASADGQYILTPRAGLENWSEIHAYIFEALNGISEKQNPNKNSVAAH